MEDKFYVKVYLVVIAVEPDPAKKDQSKFLVVGEGSDMEFPNLPLTKKDTTRDVATHLLGAYTGVTQEWAIVFPFGVVDDVDPEKDTLSVLYGVFIPGLTRLKIKDSHWKTYNELESIGTVSAFTKKLAHEAIWRQV